MQIYVALPTLCFYTEDPIYIVLSLEFYIQQFILTKFLYWHVRASSFESSWYSIAEITILYLYNSLLIDIVLFPTFIDSNSLRKWCIYYFKYILLYMLLNSQNLNCETQKFVQLYFNRYGQIALQIGFNNCSPINNA